MTGSHWERWLKDWLKAHPLKGPYTKPDPLFTHEVMERIRSEARQSHLKPRWSFFPKLAYALAGTVAIFTIVWWLRPQPPIGKIVDEIEQGAQTIWDLERIWAELEPDLDFTQTWQEYDRLVLTEVPEGVPSGSKQRGFDRMERLKDKKESLSSSGDFLESEGDWA